VVKNLARGSRHRFHTLWSAPYLTCGPSGPPRPSEAAQDSPGSTFIFPSGFQGLSASRTHSELFPVVTGRGTPRGVRGPPQRRASVNRGSSRQRAAGRPVRPPVSSPARFHRLPRLYDGLAALRCVRSLTAAPGVESGAIPPSSPSSTTASPLSAALRRRASLRPPPRLRRRSSRLHGLHGYVRSTRLPVSVSHSHRCHVAALGRSCSGRPDVEDVVLPLEPAGSLTFQGYSAQRSPPGDHLSLCLASLNSNTRGSTFLV
jgi:hypothetical protein